MCLDYGILSLQANFSLSNIPILNVLIVILNAKNDSSMHTPREIFIPIKAASIHISIFTPVL